MRAYETVALEDRTRVIELVEELRVTGETSGPHALFGARTPRVDVDAEGRIYVADGSNARVPVFAADGTHLRTLGRSGQGPGEFSTPLVAVVAGDAVYVSDTARARLSKWSLSGELVWDHQLDIFNGYLIAPQLGLADGTFLIRYHLSNSADEVIARLDAGGRFVAGSSDAAAVAPLARRSLLTRAERVFYPPRAPGASRAGQYGFLAGRTWATFVFGSEGNAYVSNYEDYQVLALSPDGGVRWALQVPWPRPALAEAEKEWGAALMRAQGYADATADGDGFEWPETQFALGDIKTDGYGRVYVFPYVPRGVTRDRFAVDVYSPAGELIFAGWMQLRRDGGIEPMTRLAWPGEWKFGPMVDAAWQVGAGDSVYGVVEDPDSKEWALTRLRLVWPQ